MRVTLAPRKRSSIRHRKGISGYTNNCLPRSSRRRDARLSLVFGPLLLPGTMWSTSRCSVIGATEASPTETTRTSGSAEIYTHVRTEALHLGRFPTARSDTK